MLFNLAKQSLLSRKTSVLITVVALTISFAMLFAVEHIRTQAKQSFQRTVSGVDLIVAARSSQINVLLSSVFGVGANANGITLDTYSKWASDKRVAWTIPMALGDSHKGFAVVGTDNRYFEHYRYANKRSLDFIEGDKLAFAYDIVIGADVAETLRYRKGDSITLSHGLGEVSFSHHHDFPFYISGVIAKTGTPVDRSLYVHLSALENIHVKPHASAFSALSRTQTPTSIESKQYSNDHVEDKHDEHGHDDHEGHEHDHSDDHHHAKRKQAPRSTQSIDSLPQATQISSFMLGLNSRIGVLTMQRDINQDKTEALSAIIPGVALAELWNLLGSVENLLLLISSLMLISALFGLATMMLASLRERSAEFAVLRIMGAQPRFIFSLIQLEVLSIVLLSQVVAMALLNTTLWLLGDWLSSEFSISLTGSIFNTQMVLVVLLTLLASFTLGLLPAMQAYRKAKTSSF
jgi:putative ABC transport system permease protein